MPDPAPLTAEQLASAWANLIPRIGCPECTNECCHKCDLVYRLMDEAVANALAALDAAEARLADARREALEEAARTCERRAETVPPTPVLSMKGELMCVAGAIRALAASRPTEETTK